MRGGFEALAGSQINVRNCVFVARSLARFLLSRLLEERVRPVVLGVKLLSRVHTSTRLGTFFKRIGGVDDAVTFSAGGCEAWRD